MKCNKYVYLQENPTVLMFSAAALNAPSGDCFLSLRIQQWFVKPVNYHLNLDLNSNVISAFISIFRRYHI